MIWFGFAVLVAHLIAPARNASDGFAVFNADEEVIGAQVLIRHESQSDGRLRCASAGAASWLTGIRDGRRGRNEGRVELAGCRLEAKALTVALGGFGKFLRQGMVRVIVVPEQSSGYHLYPSSLYDGEKSWRRKASKWTCLHRVNGAAAEKCGANASS